MSRIDVVLPVKAARAVTRIDTLTPDQIHRFPEFVKRWTAIGLSTKPAERKRAERAIRWMYKRAGKTPPRIVWTTSPLVSGLTRAITQKHTDGGASVRESVWASVWTSVRASVEASVWTSVRDSVYGQHDAGWLAFYDAMRMFGMKSQTRALRGLWSLARTAHWGLLHERIAWVSDRPAECHLDDRGRLHHPDRLALAYRDGWGIYAWHGVRVPAVVIEHPEQITVAQIDAEMNVEVRRVMIERMTSARFIRESGAERVGTDRYGVLWRRAVPNDEAVVMVEVVNSTPEPDVSRKTYHLRVPPQMTTAREAVAWTFGKTADAYAPGLET